ARLTFRATVNFQSSASLLLREATIEPAETTAYRLVHGASDQRPGWYLDRLGDFLLSQSERGLTPQQGEELAKLMALTRGRSVYEKRLTTQIRQSKTDELSPQRLLGESASGPFC